MAAKVKRYEVLIPCRNDETGKRFDVGGLVTSKDFKKTVIDNWLEITPPVLKKIEVDDGGNS